MQDQNQKPLPASAAKAVVAKHDARWLLDNGMRAMIIELEIVTDDEGKQTVQIRPWRRPA